MVIICIILTVLSFFYRIVSVILAIPSADSFGDYTGLFNVDKITFTESAQSASSLSLITAHKLGVFNVQRCNVQRCILIEGVILFLKYNDL